MPRLGAELFNLSDDEFIVANEAVDPDSSLGSNDDSARLDSGGNNPAVQNQGNENAGKAPAGTDANAGDPPVDASAEDTQSGADDADEADEDEGLDVSDDEFDPKVPAVAKPDTTDTDGKAKPAEGSPDAGTSEVPLTPPKGGDPASEVKPGETPASPLSTPLSTEQLKSFYDQVMKPFKANNKEVAIRTPEEAIRLMQMGAGYGKKLNDMQPHLKALRILEKHGLLDENRLSFLVDVNSKNPEAIKQLLRDAKIDPLDLNMEEGSEYKAPNLSVSDAEMAFKEVLTDVRASPRGHETIRHVNESWDEQSKAALWKNPEILRIIQTQRDNGIYDQIVAEVERQKLFGTIQPNTSFLAAYKIAGDSLVKAAGLDPATGNHQQVETPATVAAPVPLDTRPAKPRTPVSNDAKARAAASSTNKAAKVIAPVDMLDMSDDDFMKHFGPKF